MSEKRNADEFSTSESSNSTKKPKISSPLINTSKSSSVPLFGSTGIKLGLKKPTDKNQTKLIVTDKKLKQIFNEDDQDQDEVMPEEAKMKMKNVGRDTPTSSGPNSFSKGKKGFVDIRKLSEKKLGELTKKLNDDDSR